MSKAYRLRSRVSEASMEEMAKYERERGREREEYEPNFSNINSSVECVLVCILLCMEFSGLRSRAFCRVGKSCSLNSE